MSSAASFPRPSLPLQGTPVAVEAASFLPTRKGSGKVSGSPATPPRRNRADYFPCVSTLRTPNLGDAAQEQALAACVRQRVQASR